MTKKRFLFLLPLLVLPFASCSKQSYPQGEVVSAIDIERKQIEDLIKEAQADEDTSKYGYIESGVEPNTQNNSENATFVVYFKINPLSFDENNRNYQEVISGDTHIELNKETEFRYVKKPIVFENDCFTSIVGWSTDYDKTSGNGLLDKKLDKDSIISSKTPYIYPIFDKNKIKTFTLTQNLSPYIYPIFQNISNLDSSVLQTEFCYRERIKITICSAVNYYDVPMNISFSDNIKEKSYIRNNSKQASIEMVMPMDACEISVVGLQVDFNLFVNGTHIVCNDAPSTFHYLDEISLTLLPESNRWTLPDSVIVSGVNNYSYDKKTGVVSFIAPNNDVEITVEGDLAVLYPSISLNESTGEVIYNAGATSEMVSTSTQITYTYTSDWYSTGQTCYPYIRIKNCSITATPSSCAPSGQFTNRGWIYGFSGTSQGINYSKGLGFESVIYPSFYSDETHKLYIEQWRGTANNNGKSGYADGNGGFDISYTSKYAYTKYTRNYTSSYNFTKITWKDQITVDGVVFNLESGQGTANATYVPA